MSESPHLKVQQSLLPGLLFLSGLCGISYEVLYGRLLGNVFGDQFLVSTAVLMTFMLGIGLGAFYAHRLWRRLWLVEAGIGLYAVLFSLNLGGIESLLYAALPAIGTSVLSSLIMGVALLLVPAFLIGTSLPLFSGYAFFIRPRPEYFASVYSLYNFAAAGTVLIVEFWLIRQLGVSGAVYAVGGLNLLVALILLVSFRHIARGAPQAAEVTAGEFPRAVIVALLLSSVGSAVFQLTTVRLSELLIGPYRESFAYVLCVILLGIALGSMWVQRFRVSFTTLMVCNIISLSWMLGGLEWAMGAFAQAYQALAETYWPLVGLKLSLIAGLTLPGAVTFGATIPALLQAQRGPQGSGETDHRQTARSPGFLLYVASLANAAGFLLMSLVLHQHLDYGELLLVAAAFSCVSLIVIVRHRSKEQDPAMLSRTGQLSAAAMLCVALIGGRIEWNEELLYQGHLNFHSPAEMQFYKNSVATSERFKGPSDLFAITQRGDEPFLLINGMISIRLNSAQENLVGALASIYTSERRRALVLGVGSGATAGTVGLLFDEVEAVEISGVILDNLQRMEQYNFGLANMPNVTLIHDDAVHAVKLAQGEYSLILNTVTSPLFFSSSKLYTVEFLDQVRRHLAPGGLYLTWLDSRVGDRGADIMIETVSRAFAHCGLAQLGSNYLLLMCSDQPIAAHHPLVAEQNEILASYLRDDYDINPASLAYLLLHTDVAALRNPAGAPLNTLDRPVLEFEMAQLKSPGLEQLRQRIRDSIDPSKLANALEPLDGGLVPMLQAVVPIIYKSPYYQTLNAMLQDAQQHYRLALAAEELGDCDGVIEHMPAATALSTRIPLLHLSLGRCYEIQGRYSEALAAYKKERLVDPENAQLALVLGRVLLRQERYEEALAELQRVDQADHSGGYYFMLGATHQGLGEREKARRYFSSAEHIAGSLKAANNASLLITGQRRP